MASIQTAIELQDNFTSVMYGIIGAMDEAVYAASDLQATMNESVSAAAYDAMQSDIEQVNNGIEEAAQNQQNFNNQMHNGIGQADQLFDTVKSAIAAYATIQTVGKVLNISDELVQVNSRIGMMNDGLQSTEELTGMIFAAAQDARGSFMDMADVVARFGNNAKDAFSSSAEVVAFADLIQKQMTIAGAGTQEASNAMLQLSQALGSGVLRGDELNSIFEQAPNLIQSIADYMDVPIGKIREMAADGELSADVVKAAIFASADDINAKFESMPMTWGQLFQSFQNQSLQAFQPVLNRMNEIANSEGFQTMVTNAVNALAVLAEYVTMVVDLMIQGATFISDNWSTISPILYGLIGALALYAAYIAIVNGYLAITSAVESAVAFAKSVHAAATAMASGATLAEAAAQTSLNAALLACPLTWIILAIMALIAVVIAVANHIANMGGTATTAFGVICGGVNVVIQFFKNLGLMVANIALGIGNAIAAVASNIMTAFHNAICSVQAWWYDLLSTVLTVVAGICEALNKLPFVEFDYSGITSAANDYAAKSAEAAGNKESYTSVADAFNEGMSTFDAFGDGWISDAYDAGAAWGDGISNKVSGMFTAPDQTDYTAGLNTAMADATSGIGDIAGDTSAIKDSMDITEEDLKYLRDIAEQEAVNRFTTAEITIDQSGMVNNVNNGMDLDGVVSGLTDAVNDAVDTITEGVHD